MKRIMNVLMTSFMLILCIAFNTIAGNFSDNGNEVGSINYISISSHYFIRAKALQNEYFLPILDNETAVPIRPQVFSNFNLKEGDILISKDSNIGEIVILDKNYPNVTELLKDKPNLKIKELSKQFVRDVLIEKGFSYGSEGEPPSLTDEDVIEVSYRYINLYEKLTGKRFKFPNIHFSYRIRWSCCC